MRFLIGFLTVLLLPAWAGAQGAPYSAVVLDLSGQAAVSRQGSPKPLELGGVLYPQEVVETAPGASLTVNYLESGEEEQWPGAMKFTVGQGRSNPLPPQVKRLNRKVALPSLTYPSGGKALMSLPAEGPPGGMIVRGGSGETAAQLEPGELPEAGGPKKALPAIAVKCLSNSATLAERPNFSWEAVKGAGLYQVTLYPLGQNQPFWRQLSTKPELPYPAKEPALSPGGRYVWEVEARKDGKTVAQARSCFSLPGKKELASLKAQQQKFAARLAAHPGDTPTRLAFIFFLEEHSLYDAALAQYGVLRAVGKESGALKTREERLLKLRAAPCGMTP